MKAICVLFSTLRLAYFTAAVRIPDVCASNRRCDIIHYTDLLTNSKARLPARTSLYCRRISMGYRADSGAA